MKNNFKKLKLTTKEKDRINNWLKGLSLGLTHNGKNVTINAIVNKSSVEYKLEEDYSTFRLYAEAGPCRLLLRIIEKPEQDIGWPDTK